MCLSLCMLSWSIHVRVSNRSPIRSRLVTGLVPSSLHKISFLEDFTLLYAHPGTSPALILFIHTSRPSSTVTNVSTELVPFKVNSRDVLSSDWTLRTEPKSLFDTTLFPSCLTSPDPNVVTSESHS